MKSFSFLWKSLIPFYLVVSCSSDDPSVEWESLQSMPTARHSFGLVEFNGILYAIGGYSATGVKVVEAYDPSTKAWTTKESMPTGRGYLIVAKAAGKIYAIGGITGANLNNISYLYVNEEYDPVTNTWISKAPLPLDVMPPNSVLGNQFITGGTIDDKIYVMGGSSSGTVPTFIYDPSTNTWSKNLTPLEIFSNEPYSSTTLNGEIYVNHGATFIKYNTSDNEWRLLESSDVPRYGVALAAEADKIYGIGGYSWSTSGYSLSNFVEFYSTEDKNWSSYLSLDYPRHSAAAIVINNKLYVAGGAKVQNNVNIPIADFEATELK